MAIFERRPQAVLVHSDADWMDEAGRVYRRGMTQRQRANDRSRLTHLTGQDVSFILPSAMVVRREAFELIGGFDPALHSAEDLDLPMRLRALGEIVFLREAGLAYRVHDKSLTRNGGRTRFVSGERLCRKLAARFANDPAKALEVERVFAEHYRIWARDYFSQGRLREAVPLWLRAAAHELKRLRRFTVVARPQIRTRQGDDARAPAARSIPATPFEEQDAHTLL